MRRFLAFFLLLQWYSEMSAQSVYAPLDQDYYHLIDRMDVLNKNFSRSLHTSYKPYKQIDIVSTVDSSGFMISSRDKFNAEYLKIDNWGDVDESFAQSNKPLLKVFYRTKSDFLHVNTKGFRLRVNPILYLSAGKDSNSSSSPYINTRGAKIQGIIDDKVGFYASIEETQAIFPKYVQDYTTVNGVVPGENHWKGFGDQGIDVMSSRGYFTFNATKHIALQFGHDKNFIGNGYRSLLLSDFSAPSTFLKIQTKIWKIQYTNLYTELIADAPYTATGSLGIEEYPKKVLTAHHLSWNVADNFNVGVFEAIMFHRDDSTGSSFEWNYLNPIIFYRSIELHTGSPDNSVFGLDFKWNIFKGVQLYGQGLLDELIVGELKSGDGWWGNKFSAQVGLKYYNVLGINNLDLQVEHNLARPFTYSHNSIFTNYAHYRMPLAHGLGANFDELVIIAKYQPLNRLKVTAKVIMANFGVDTDGENYGGNVLKNYDTRTQEYGNKIGQGVSNKLVYLDASVSYMLRHNLFLDLRHIYRNQSSDDVNLSSTTHFSSFALRLNIAARDQSL